MAQVKPRSTPERISKLRAAKASLLTGLFLLAFGQVSYHLYWAIGALRYSKYGGTLNTVAVVIGSLVVNLFITTKVLMFFETKLLSDQIDADHKKYL